MKRLLPPPVRALLGAPSYSLTTVLSLGLGMALAACTASVVNAYLVRTMPFPGADRLYHILYSEPRQMEPAGIGAIDWRALADIVDVADSSGTTRLHLTGAPWLEEIVALRTVPRSVQGITFPVIAGRSLIAADFAPGAERVIIIGSRLWRDRYAGDPAVVGRVIQVAPGGGSADASPVRVVGVLRDPVRAAQTFERGELDAVVPLAGAATTYMVRLRGGIAPGMAERRIEAAVRSVATALPDAWRGVRLESVHARYTASTKPVLAALSVAAFLVVTIICANVIVLSLLRAMRREKEMAVRSALGASRRRLAGVVASESAIVVGAAIVVGLVVTWLVLGALSPVIEQRLGRAPTAGAGTIGIDATVLLTVVALAVVAAGAVALPGLLQSDQRLAATLRRAGFTGADGPGARSARAFLVGAEVALAMMLLVGSGLMIERVRTLLSTDLGIDTRQVMRARISVPARRYATDSAMSRFYSALAAASPAGAGGSLALTSGTPFYEPARYPVETESGATRSWASVIAAAGDYFVTVRLPVRQGRGFRPQDGWGAAPVALVSETLARTLWPGANPVGRRLRPRAQNSVADTLPGPWRTVVGVVGDVRQGFDDANLGDLYVPFAQAPTQYAQFMVRGGDGAAAIAELRAVATALDPATMVAFATSLEEETDRALAGPRFIMAVLSAFAIAALLIAVLGLYGITACAVQQRQREVAIRLALGATASHVVRLFVSQGGRTLVAGLMAGALGAVALGRVLASQLHGVSAFDVAAMVGAGALTLAAGFLATWWPTRRATTLSPAVILKEG